MMMIMMMICMQVYESSDCIHRDIPATSLTWTGHLTTTLSCPTLETMRSCTVSADASRLQSCQFVHLGALLTFVFSGDVPNGCELIRNRSECKDIDWATYTCVLGYHVFGQYICTHPQVRVSLTLTLSNR